MRLEYEGRFLAEIEDYGLFQSQSSQALAIDLFFSTLAYFRGDAQEEFSGYQTRGRFFVIGKTGDVLKEQVAAMADATGWDGDLNVLFQQSWNPQSPVQIIVRKETVKDTGRTYHNAIRILRSDWQPSRAGNVSGEDGRLIAARYTSALKSVVSNYRRQRGEEPAPAPVSQPRPKPSPEAPAPEPAETSEPVTWTVESLWARFVENAGDMNEQGIEEVWDEVIRYHCNGREITELSQEEMATIAAIDPDSWIPF